MSYQQGEQAKKIDLGEGNTIARVNKAGKHFEIIVNLEAALNFKKSGQGSSADFLEFDTIFSDAEKGNRASNEDLEGSFGITDVNEIAEKIVKDGDVLENQEHRDAEKEKKFKQIVDFLSRNAVDPKTGNPHTAERIKNALEQANINIKDTSVDKQVNEIVEQLREVLPIKIETKKIKINIPAIHTGRVYGLVNEYKEKENWLNDGSLEVIVNVPSGAIMDFYDKLNSMTQGSAITEEIKENE